MTSPGSAIGVFTVGNAIGPMAKCSEVFTRTCGISNKSSRGGTDAFLEPGRGRTIVDLAAHGKYVPAPDGDGDAIFFEYTQAKGTSFAAPIAAAAGVDFLDFHRRTTGDFALDPGVVFVNLLIMGDLAALDDNLQEEQILTGFDRHFGAGRLRMRRFDGTGLDGPFEYSTGAECIAGGETLTIALNGGKPLPADVDVVKSAIFWYDRRHEIMQMPPTAIVNLDLTLWEVDENLQPLNVLATSAALHDNKERVVHAGVGGKQLVLEIAAVGGFDPNFNYGTGCNGPGRIRVHDAYFWEDSDRDDLFGPFWDPDTLVGAEPEVSP